MNQRASVRLVGDLGAVRRAARRAARRRRRCRSGGRSSARTCRASRSCAASGSGTQHEVVARAVPLEHLEPAQTRQHGVGRRGSRGGRLDHAANPTASQPSAEAPEPRAVTRRQPRCTSDVAATGAPRLRAVAAGLGVRGLDGGEDVRPRLLGLGACGCARRCARAGRRRWRCARSRRSSRGRRRRAGPRPRGARTSEMPGGGVRQHRQARRARLERGDPERLQLRRRDERVGRGERGLARGRARGVPARSTTKRPYARPLRST